jgi:hypothetical protein
MIEGNSGTKVPPKNYIPDASTLQTKIKKKKLSRLGYKF